MFRLVIGLCIVALIACLCGCGGGSGSGGDPSSNVSIRQYSIFAHSDEYRTKFFPKTTTVVAGADNGITWINQTPERHQIFSGMLTAKGNSSETHDITINFGNFSPNSLEADAGNTIRINNHAGRQFTMQIVNDNGVVVSTLIFAIGEMRTVVFPGPGVWVVQDPDTQLVATITLFGRPMPDGQFQSGILLNGSVFSRAFPVPGTYSYYDVNPDDPTHVYATGTIVVQ